MEHKGERGKRKKAREVVCRRSGAIHRERAAWYGHQVKQALVVSVFGGLMSVQRRVFIAMLYISNYIY